MWKIKTKEKIEKVNKSPSKWYTDLCFLEIKGEKSAHTLATTWTRKNREQKTFLFHLVSNHWAQIRIDRLTEKEKTQDWSKCNDRSFFTFPCMHSSVAHTWFSFHSIHVLLVASSCSKSIFFCRSCSCFFIVHFSMVQSAVDAAFFSSFLSFTPYWLQFYHKMLPFNYTEVRCGINFN